MRLIVTRPQEDARSLGRRLTTAGHTVIAAPLLSIRRIAEAPIPERPYQAVLITSANGARALEGRSELERLKSATALVVGRSSAVAAAGAGFARIEVAGGDVAALARRAVQLLRPDDGPLLYVSGAVTAGELASDLAASGFEVDRVVAYVASPAVALPKRCATALAAGKVDGVILFSPRTARIWATLAAAAGQAPAAVRLVHYCLSQNVAATVCNTLGAGVTVEVARRPDEAALLELFATPG